MQDYELLILTELVEDVKVDVINSMQAAGRYASGDTIKALEVVQNGNQVRLEAPDYIDILERGRGPTSPDALAGNPTVFQLIEKWIADKGLDLNPYAVTKNIHKKGYAGKPGVLTEPLSDENVDKHATMAAENLATLLITSTLKI